MERFAPGFRERILARSTRTPAQLERYNPTCVGGDILGGRNDLWQLDPASAGAPLASRGTPEATTRRVGHLAARLAHAHSVGSSSSRIGVKIGVNCPKRDPEARASGSILNFDLVVSPLGLEPRTG